MSVNLLLWQRIATAKARQCEKSAFITINEAQPMRVAWLVRADSFPQPNHHHGPKSLSEAEHDFLLHIGLGRCLRHVDLQLSGFAEHCPLGGNDLTRVPNV